MKIIVFALLSLLLLAACTADRDWRTASREPAGIAPDPVVTDEAVLHVYGAPAWGWRGWFAGPHVEAPVIPPAQRGRYPCTTEAWPRSTPTGHAPTRTIPMPMLFNDLQNRPFFYF